MISVKSASYIQDKENISTIALGSAAAKTAIDQCKMSPGDIGLLINIGTYRDDNLVEPAEAALMQQAAGLNLDSRREVKGENGAVGYEPAPTTFSFDVLGGACGFFNALEIVDSFVSNGTVSGGLIISANVHPSKTDRPDFPFAPLGSAMVVGPGSDGTGFFDIKGYTSEAKGEGINGSIDILDHSGDGRERIDIKIDDDFEANVLEFALEKGRQYLADRGLSAADFDYIVATEYSADFLTKLAEGLGLEKEKCRSFYGEFGSLHSSAPIVALSRPENVAPGKRGLIVGAGSGLTCYFAQYNS